MHWWQARRPNRMFFNRGNSWICLQSEMGSAVRYVAAILVSRNSLAVRFQDKPASPSRILAECAVTFIDAADYRSLGVFAKRAGFRPCKRCKPEQASLTDQHAAGIAELCRLSVVRLRGGLAR